ncbi:class I SAM-dependent methyltransferase [Oceanobacillus massiliensis]|uniref:class I SAM-dependent methyltransferase n=2 Tax=Oceanobacillus massiliensis TaxID=1465765 RepID=UPI000288D959|nr:class I SAM-dependent methyltransferase [Oceanobacillus massiliensis]
MLEDTGERVIPEKMKITNELLLEHVARYHFSINYARGRVLDFASGSGYGSHIIAKKCKKRVNEVIGVDIDKEAITYARGTYYHPLTTFLKEDVVDPTLPEKLGQFDTILSFETIEHIENEQQFLSNIYQLLKPEGTLVLSTPFGKGRGRPCGSPFHVHQLTIEEFKILFANYSETTFYYQKGALIERAGYETIGQPPLGIVVCRK